MTLLLVFIFGLIIGSFLNAVIFRLHSGESFVNGRSHCIHCKRELRVLDLVPLFSFIYLRGRCRYCHKKISWQYPIIELATALTFILLARNFQFFPPQSSIFNVGGIPLLAVTISNFQFWFQLVFTSILIVIAMFDLKHYLILDKVIFPAMGLSLIYNVYLDLSLKQSFFGWHSMFVLGLLSGLGLAAFFALQFLISRGRWIGFGDVKLGFLLGLILGWPQSLAALILAYFSGALVGLSLIALGKKQLSSKLPFGTFLGFSAIIITIWGQPMVHWYLKLIGL